MKRQDLNTREGIPLGFLTDGAKAIEPQEKELNVNRISINSLIHALVLVRLGQELGTDSALARGIAAACEIAQKLSAVFVVDMF